MSCIRQYSRRLQTQLSRTFHIQYRTLSSSSLSPSPSKQSGASSTQKVLYNSVVENGDNSPRPNVSKGSSTRDPSRSVMEPLADKVVTRENISFEQQHFVNVFSPKIVVVGVGGAGGNAVNNMIFKGLEGVQFIVCNTDAQHLSSSLTQNRIQMGRNITGGLGCGANPEVGRLAALESEEEIQDAIGDANMVFVTAGMGGGTGTGAAPVIAKACMERNLLTVAVTTKPFKFEGGHRMRLAESGLDLLKESVDTMIVIPNQNLFTVATKDTILTDAFRMADDVLLAGVKNITDLMVKPGLINLDFADVQSVMLNMGTAMMGTGEAEGSNRATQAAEDALRNPLLGNLSIQSAKGLLVNISGGEDMTLFEVDAAADKITKEVEDPSANIIFGTSFDPSLQGKIRVSVVATGIEVTDL